MDTLSQIAPYSEIAGAVPQAAPGPQTAPFASMVSPQPDVSQVAKPATSPEEIEQRKAGWQQIMSNPNFMRALGYMGTQLMQPIQPGQTRMGHLGRAAQTGMTAFQMGEYAQYEQDRQAREDARKQKESDANVAATEATTALNKERLPGVRADAEVAAQTTQARIDKVKKDVEKATLDIDRTKLDNELKTMEKELKARQKSIMESIPDETLRKAEMAKVDAQILEVDAVRARIAASRAAAGASGAQTKLANAQLPGVEAEGKMKALTAAEIEKLSPEDKLAYASKTGRFSAASSVTAQSEQMWSRIYDGLPAEDPAKKLNKAQYVQKMLTSGKAKDAAETLAKLLAAGETDEALLRQLRDLAKSNASSPAPAAATGDGSKLGPGQVRDKSGKAVNYSSLKKGDLYTDPKGIAKVKQ